MEVTTFTGADGNTYLAGATIGVSASRKCFGPACFSSSGSGSSGSEGYLAFKGKIDGIPLSDGQINFPDLVPTNETQARLEAQKQHFEKRLNELLKKHASLEPRALELHGFWRRRSYKYMYPDEYYAKKVAEDPEIIAYEENLEYIENWNGDFKQHVAGIGEDMIAACIPCSQIKDFLIDQYGDVLEDNFMSLCEEIASQTDCSGQQQQIPPQDTRIPTDCCVLVCCEPEKYKLIQ